jgi:hypothetical protein
MLAFKPGGCLVHQCHVLAVGSGQQNALQAAVDSPLHQHAQCGVILSAEVITQMAAGWVKAPKLLELDVANAHQCVRCLLQVLTCCLHTKQACQSS